MSQPFFKEPKFRFLEFACHGDVKHMIPQERRFTLAEVNTKVGPMGQVQLDQGFLEVLGVSPGDSISFLIDAKGVVTVRGEKKPQEDRPSHPGSPALPLPGEVAQAALFSEALPPKPVPKTRRPIR